MVPWEARGYKPLLVYTLTSLRHSAYQETTAMIEHLYLAIFYYKEN